ncbi:MAG: hypothetical protein QOE29_1818 [Gaiellaceae bacterium]|jgi:hypothetical protein|nr:hypothetical protein [Gaiellaceae bacterium]MDX6516458.1 hypothetical protein [Gaiellaceae bacterium]
MNLIAHLIGTTFGTETGIRCRSCGDAIGLSDEFGRSERACKRCRRR